MRSTIGSPTPSLARVREAAASAHADVGRFPQIRGIVLLALTVLVIWLNLTFLKPLIMGAIFASVLYPLMGRWESAIASRTWRAGAITALFAIAFLIPIGILLYMSADAAIRQIRAFPGLNLSGGQFSPQAMIDMLNLQPWIEWLHAVSPLSEDQIVQMVSSIAVTVGSFLVNVFQGLLASLPGIIFANTVILLTVFFLLIDGARAVDFVRSNSFFGPKQTERLISATTSLCYSVVVASIVTAFVQAALVGVASLIAGVSNVVLIILVTFISSFLPVVGTLPVTGSLALYCFSVGNIKGGIVFLVFILLVGASDNIVRPLVLKGGAQLHPLVGFVAAFGALDAIGFYGLFIGPIVAGLFFVVLPMVTRSYGNNSRLSA